MNYQRHCSPKAVSFFERKRRSVLDSGYPTSQRPRDSAYEIGFALQIPKNREHVSRFFDSEREKSFCTGTFFRPCFAKSKHICRRNCSFATEKRKKVSHERKEKTLPCGTHLHRACACHHRRSAPAKPLGICRQLHQAVRHDFPQPR